MERTCAILKPDCVEGKHCTDVVKAIVEDGFKIVAVKQMKLDENILRSHYAHHADKPFFPELVSFMTRTPVLVMLLEKEGAVSELRKLCGPTDSQLAKGQAPNSLRARFGKDKSENIIHASDASETALAEEKRFFTSEELSKVNVEGISFEKVEEAINQLYG